MGFVLCIIDGLSLAAARLRRRSLVLRSLFRSLPRRTRSCFFFRAAVARSDPRSDKAVRPNPSRRRTHLVRPSPRPPGSSVVARAFRFLFPPSPPAPPCSVARAAMSAPPSKFWPSVGSKWQHWSDLLLATQLAALRAGFNYVGRYWDVRAPRSLYLRCHVEPIKGQTARCMHVLVVAEASDERDSQGWKVISLQNVNLDAKRHTAHPDSFGTSHWQKVLRSAATSLRRADRLLLRIALVFPPTLVQVTRSLVFAVCMTSRAP